MPAVDGAGQDGAGDAAVDSNAAAVDVSVCENARQLEKLGALLLVLHADE